MKLYRLNFRCKDFRPGDVITLGDLGVNEQEAGALVDNGTLTEIAGSPVEPVPMPAAASPLPSGFPSADLLARVTTEDGGLVFGTLEAVAGATLKDLQGVRGMGPSRAREAQAEARRILKDRY